ncbi:MAG: hypothetical protein ACUVRG_08290 [Ignavibacterium sp.]|uniref:hypothetical protein n=1 Tax=Ignavibacterium sp. TaxID=2651167 RepID=UPI004049B6EA
MYVKKTVQNNKNGKERVYLYLVRSVRKGNRVKQEFIGTLGRIDKMLYKKEIEHLIESLSNIIEQEKGKQFFDISHLFCDEVLEYGLAYVLDVLWNKIELKKTLSAEFEKVKRKESAELEV